MKEPILITGSHRSGTTWVGNIIRNLPRIYYLHEPLTPNSITRGLFNTEIWYKYYDPEKEYENIETILNELFSGSYPFKAMFHFKNGLPHTDYRNPAEWIHQKWNSKNVILIRHPAAFVSSLIRLNWRFNFENFTKQPDLIDRFLGPYRSQINNPPKDFISEASLIWTCITKIIIEYQKLYPNWLYIRHEDLSYDPIKEYELLFEKLKLPFSNEVKKVIHSSSNFSNPSEVANSKVVHQLQRNSRDNIKNWKKRLNNKDINKVRDLTEHLSQSFYSEKDW